MGKHDDIINLPHHRSSKRPHMSLEDRAAQFAPFAALTGYGAAVEETARLTEGRTELSEGRKGELNLVLHKIVDQLHRQPLVEATFFLPDDRKEGGAYVTATGNVRRIDGLAQRICFTDGRIIPMEDLYELEMIDI